MHRIMVGMGGAVHLRRSLHELSISVDGNPRFEYETKL